MNDIELNKVAEVKLVYKTKVKASERAQVKGAEDAYNILKDLYDQDSIEHQESSIILLLNRANRTLGARQISTGGLTGTIMDIKLILQYCLLSNASSVIVSHNHPSGNLQPSEADIKITNKLKEACSILDLNLLDHIIITPYDGFKSLADEGLL